MVPNWCSVEMFLLVVTGRYHICGYCQSNWFVTRFNAVRSSFWFWLLIFMAELHVIGQITGACGFPEKKLFCVWEISSGGAWTLISGDKDGQTQVDRSEIDDFALWSHPLDIHFATKGIQGWPKMSFQVWSVDAYNRSEICAYGFCNIPASPGEHKVECETWRPVGGLRDRIVTFFLGGGPQLRDLNVVHNGAQRHRLYTKSMGKIFLEIGVLMRGFEKYGVEFS